MKLSKKTTAFLIAGFFFFMLTSNAVNALPDFMLELPDEGKNLKCRYCHLNTNGGGERNNFGNDFHENDNKYNSNLSALDSDGDGFTNGQEFASIPVTNPGDPDSHPDPVSERNAIIATVSFTIGLLVVGLILIWRK